jgi:hypothetical protein
MRRDFPTVTGWRQYRRMVTLQAVIFDLDDTLIVGEAVARASLRSTAQLVPGADPGRVGPAGRLVDGQALATPGHPSRRRRASPS